MEVKIILDNSAMQMSRKRGEPLEDTIEFIRISKDGEYIALYLEGFDDEGNNANIELTKRQARHFANALLDLIKE